MSTIGKINEKMTQYRWTICTLLFFATTINYLDRQVLSLLQPILADEFHWTDSDYGTITAIFSLAYAVSMLFAGRFVDKLGTRKGYAWAIAVWSVAAMLHALCGLATEWWTGIPDAKGLTNASGEIVATISLVSVAMFVIARILLAFGESANFPAAIKATAEYFPKKDRALATSIFNAGATVGALAAPVTIPVIAKYWGWETAFLVIGAVGFLWLAAWLIFYKPIETNKKVNDAERAYIHQDDITDKVTADETVAVKKMTFGQALKFKQTWAFAFGKFMTDGVWWFFLFWTPAYLKAEYGMSPSEVALPIGVLYTLTVFGSVFGGKFPTFFINKGMNPYAGRMRAMLIIAFIPLLVLLAQPFGHISALGNLAYWVPVILIGLGASAHQAWSANIFTTVGDMFPKSAVATIIGIGGMAGGIGSFIINKGSGVLFDYSLVEWGSKTPGYTIVFSFCAVAYLIGWVVMKTLVPKYKPIVVD